MVLWVRTNGERMSEPRYWKVYEVDNGHRFYCGVFRAPDAATACRVYRKYHDDHTLRYLRDTLEAEETTDGHLIALAEHLGKKRGGNA